MIDIESCEDGVQQLFHKIDRKLVRRFKLLRKPVLGGISYRRGRKCVMRIDFKEAALRARVGADLYATAAPQLRGRYRQANWIRLTPEYGRLGEEYVLYCAERALTEMRS